jgi:uncharacterized RmlC-like cupin family protein
VLLLTLLALVGMAPLSAPALTVVVPGHEHWVAQPDRTSMAILYGDPSKPGLYILLMKLPANWSESPHYHPQTENVSLISGTAYLGIGRTFNKKAMVKLKAGTFVSIPAKAPHYAMTGALPAVIQVMAIGPYKEIAVR